MKVGFFVKNSSLVSSQVIETGFLNFLGRYVETLPVPTTNLPATAPLRRGLIDGDALIAQLTPVLANLDALKLDYLYTSLASLTPYLLIARALSGARLSFLVPTLCVSTDLWFIHWLLLAPWLRPDDVVMIPNASIGGALARISPVYARRGSPVPWPIDLDRVDQALAGHRRVSPRTDLIYVGRIVENKNVHLLVEAMPDVLSEVPDARLRLFVPRMTGELNVAPDYYQRLRQRCRQLALGDRVEFVGPVGEQAKYRHMADAAALVSLSLFAGETFGYAILEALACGTPVVCTAWNGHKDLVTHRLNGFLVPTFWQGEHAQLDPDVAKYALLNALLGDAPAQNALSDRARASAAQYDYRHVIPQLVDTLAARRPFAPRDARVPAPGPCLDTLLRQRVGDDEHVWARGLTQFEPLAPLSYGSLAGIRSDPAQEGQVIAFLKAIGAHLAPYLHAGYVSEGQPFEEVYSNGHA